MKVRVAGRSWECWPAWLAISVSLAPASLGCAGRVAVADLHQARQQVEAYIDSGRYVADCAAVTAKAQEYLERRAPRVKKPAAVFDIDETSLSNWPAYRANGWGRITAGPCDLDNGPCGLRTWQAMAQSKAIPSTLALARRARDMGVAVFFISGRPPNLREATERNLRAEGYEWERVILLPEGASFKSAVDFKAPERRKLSDEGYTILFSIGDQQSDLAGGYAERTFKLPNPVYFLP
jgi:predicted secreted acid phosphatase